MYLRIYADTYLCIYVNMLIRNYVFYNIQIFIVKYLCKALITNQLALKAVVKLLIIQNHPIEKENLKL